MQKCLRVKNVKTAKRLFTPKEKELTRAEYERLCQAAALKKNERLSLVMQTICATGIRVSELQYVTVEAVKKGLAEVYATERFRIVLDILLFWIQKNFKNLP